MTPFRSELRFAALVAYCPRGEGQEAANSRRLMLQVKENRIVRSPGRTESAAAFVARRLREMSPAFVPEFLGPKAVLVPIPRSSLQKRGALWPANEIATALNAEGLGERVLPCLERLKAVPKAATAASKERPKAHAHFDSLKLLDPLELPSSITLVDDILTRGAQMLGAAWRIWSQRPDVVVRGFAVIRTNSDPGEFSRIADPCVGVVELRRDDCFRSP